MTMGSVEADDRYRRAFADALVVAGEAISGDVATGGDAIAGCGIAVDD